MDANQSKREPRLRRHCLAALLAGMVFADAHAGENPCIYREATDSPGCVSTRLQEQRANDPATADRFNLEAAFEIERKLRTQQSPISEAAPELKSRRPVPVVVRRFDGWRPVEAAKPQRLPQATEEFGVTATATAARSLVEAELPSSDRYLGRHMPDVVTEVPIEFLDLKWQLQESRQASAPQQQRPKRPIEIAAKRMAAQKVVSSPGDKVAAMSESVISSQRAADDLVADSIASVSHSSQPPMSGKSLTQESCRRRAAEAVDRAYQEHDVSAWASAEDSLWKALHWTATGIDVAGMQAGAKTAPMAARSLHRARVALREARDFSISGESLDPQVVASIMASHQTPGHCGGIEPTVTAAEALDRYLEFVRRQLAPIASASVDAAQAMDLMAAVQLGRKHERWLPEETALCLRRAALQGQPGNAKLAALLGMQLAEMGLVDEAKWTLERAMRLEPSKEVAAALARITGDVRVAGSGEAHVAVAAKAVTDRRNFPEVVQLSPAEFAEISPAFNTAAQMGNAKTPSQPQPQLAAEARTNDSLASLVGFRKNHSVLKRGAESESNSGTVESDQKGRPSVFKKVAGKLGQIWR